MTEAASDGPDSTFRLIYRSHSRIHPEQRKAELGAIFSVARSANKKAGITGALLVSGDWFVQALEGDEQAVRSLYEHICKDHRHERVAIVDEQVVEGRAFARWAMARVSEDGEPDIPLINNRDKGGISRAAPRPTAPEQDTVLAFMRGQAPTTVST